MASPHPVLVTADDYRLMPETGPRYQLIEGELFMSPAPNRYHQRISLNIDLILGNYLLKNPIGELYDAPFDVFLTETNVFQPDKVFVANNRKSILNDEGAQGAPNLVVEILSPSTAHLDKQPKRKVYAATGVEEFWLIDPVRKVIEVTFLQQNAETPAATYGEKDVFTSPSFPGLNINAAEIFRE